MNVGQIVSIERVQSGVTVADSYTVGATILAVDTAIDLDPEGGELALPDGSIVTYLPGDIADDVVLLSPSLPVDLEDGDWLTVHPPEIRTRALVLLDGDVDLEPLPVDVPSDLAGWANLEPGAALAFDDVNGRLVARDVVGDEPGKIVAGNPYGRAVEIDSEALTIYDMTAEGERYTSSMLGGPGDDSFTLTAATGETVAGFSAEGEVVGQSASISGDMYVAGRPLLGTFAPEEVATGEAGWLDDVASSVVARDAFTVTHPTSGTRASGEEWGYAALRATLRPGRLYRVAANWQATAGVAGSYVTGRIRYSAGGSANQNSAQIARSETTPASSSTTTAYSMMEGYVEVAEETDGEFLLTYFGAGGATPRLIRADMLVLDVGAAVPLDGGSYKELAPPSSGSEPPPPPSTKKKYTSIWRATDSATYTSSGSQRSGTSGDMVQGYYSAYGSQRGCAVFTGTAYSGETDRSIGGALAGATVHKVEVYVYVNHTYNSAGGRVLLGPLGASTLGSTISSSVVGTMSRPSGKTIKAGSGAWFPVPANFFADGNRGLVIGNRTTTSMTHYLRVNGHSEPRPPAVRITYTR